MKKLLNIFITIIFLYLVYSFTSQNVLIESSKYIDCNTISTPFWNNGSFNWNSQTSNPGFEWPKGSNKFARYASGLWLGAIVDGDTLVAVANLAPEFTHGYTDVNGNYQGKNDTNYRVYRLDHGINNQDRASWPNILLGNSDQGAPVFFDTISNTWKPMDMSSQTIFMSYTDSDSTVHGSNGGGTAPLKADVKMLNFANGGLSGPLAHTIFTEYKIINRSNKVWNNVYISVWSDDDIGDHSDDAYGCDTNLSLGYAYNKINNDQIYGTAPPAVGLLFLKGAETYTGNINDTVKYCSNKNKLFKTGYKDNSMTVARMVLKNWPLIWSTPLNYRETYNSISGKFKNGDNIYHPNGYPTKYTFSGDPVTNTGWVYPESYWYDLKYILSSGPLTMNPGDTQTIVFAQIIARGNSNLNSITVLREYAQAVRDYYNSCYTSVPIGIEPVLQSIPDRFELYQNYPNPFNPRTIIRFTTPKSPSRGIGMQAKGDFIKIIIYNSLGQEVNTFVNDKMNSGIHEVEFNGNIFASGVYFYSLIVNNNLIQTKKMLLLK